MFSRFDAARTLLSQTESRGLFLASLCRGTEVLAAAGALRGKNAAISQHFDRSNQLALKSSGARWVMQSVTHDGRVITGRDDQVAESFAEELVAALREYEPAR